VNAANRQILGTDDLHGKLPYLVPIGGNEKEGKGIHFDVAVTAKAEGAGKTGAKVRLYVVDADIEAKGGISNETISRVRFNVAVDSRLGYTPAQGGK
jgi:hypothetical protein